VKQKLGEVSFSLSLELFSSLLLNLDHQNNIVVSIIVNCSFRFSCTSSVLDSKGICWDEE
jgi:hypothetical protein